MKKPCKSDSMLFSCGFLLLCSKLDQLKLRRNHFDGGWQWLTTAAHEQKWLIEEEKNRPNEI